MLLLSLSPLWFFATPWTAAHQAPLSVGFLRQESWSGLHFLLQRIFLTQGLNLRPLHCRWTLYRWATGKAPDHCVPALTVPRPDIRQQGAAPLSESQLKLFKVANPKLASHGNHSKDTKHSSPLSCLMTDPGASPEWHWVSYCVPPRGLWVTEL